MISKKVICIIGVILTVLVGVCIYLILKKKKDSFSDIPLPMPSVLGRYVKINAPVGQPINIAGVFIYGQNGNNLITNQTTAMESASMNTVYAPANNALNIIFATDSNGNNNVNRNINNPQLKFENYLYITSSGASYQLSQDWSGKDKNIAHSNGGIDSNDYWEFDFGTDVNISAVEIYTRIDCCQERNTNLSVMVINNNKNEVQLNTPAEFAPVILSTVISNQSMLNTNATTTDIPITTITDIPTAPAITALDSTNSIFEPKLMIITEPVVFSSDGNNSIMFIEPNEPLSLNSIEIELLFSYTNYGMILNLQSDETNGPNFQASMLEIAQDETNGDTLYFGIYNMATNSYDKGALFGLKPNTFYYVLIGIDIPNKSFGLMVNKSEPFSIFTSQNNFFPNSLYMQLGSTDVNTYMITGNSFSGTVYGLNIWSANSDIFKNNTPLYNQYLIFTSNTTSDAISINKTIPTTTSIETNATMPTITMPITTMETNMNSKIINSSNSSNIANIIMPTTKNTSKINSLSSDGDMDGSSSMPELNMPLMPQIPIATPGMITNLLNNGVGIDYLTSQGMALNSAYRGPSTNIIQTNFSGTSNVYSPFLYYNKGSSERFIGKLYHPYP